MVAICWVIASGCWLGALASAYFGFVHGRPRGRQRCPKCWYDMSGADGLTCPECGRAACSPRNLCKIHRRWSLGVLALVVALAGAFTAAWPTIRTEGIVSLSPTRVLIFIAPHLDSPNTVLGPELRFRAVEGMLSESDWRAFYGMIARGDQHARPPTSAWRSKYYSLLQQVLLTNYMVAPRILNRPEDHPGKTGIDHLWDLPVTVELTVPDESPSDQDVAVTIFIRNHWPIPNRAAARLILIDDPEFEWSIWGPGQVLVPNRYAADGTLGFRAEIVQQRGDPGEWQDFDTQEVEVEVTLAGPTSELFHPTHQSTGLDRYLSGITATIFCHEGLVMAIDLVPTQRPATLGTVAFGVQLEITQAGEPVVWTIASWLGPGQGHYYVRLPWEGDLDRLATIREDGSWRMKMTSDPLVAVRVPGAKEHWEGEVTIPLHMYRE